MIRTPLRGASPLVLLLIYLVACHLVFVFSGYGAEGEEAALPGETKEDVGRLFLEANRSFEVGDFEGAIEHYERIIGQGIRNGPLYYNLGNSYFKLGLLGKAIVSYRRAELYMPRDEDLRVNLKYAREMTKDRIELEGTLHFLGRLCFWYSQLNVNELCAAFLICNSLFWALALLRTFWKEEAAFFGLIISSFFLVLFSISCVVKVYAFFNNTAAVVTATEISVRSGSSLNDTVLFRLHDGAEVRLTDRRSEWRKIQLPDGKRGWVEGGLVEEVRTEIFKEKDGLSREAYGVPD
jgi:hypothetical protein